MSEAEMPTLLWSRVASHVDPTWPLSLERLQRAETTMTKTLRYWLVGHWQWSRALPMCVTSPSLAISGVRNKMMEAMSSLALPRRTGSGR